MDFDKIELPAAPIPRPWTDTPPDVGSGRTANRWKALDEIPLTPPSHLLSPRGAGVVWSDAPDGSRKPSINSRSDLATPTEGGGASRPRIAAFKSALESPERPLSNAAKSVAVAVQLLKLARSVSRWKGGVMANFTTCCPILVFIDALES